MQIPPVFIDVTLEDQALELRSYFKGLGAEISEEKSPKGIEDDLHKIIGVCEACFKEGNESEVEMILNDIVSIMVLIPLDRCESIIMAFCEKLSKAPGQKLGISCLRVLWLLFQSLDESSPIRYNVYYHILLIAKQTDQVRSVYEDIAHLKQLFNKCPPSNEQLQKLYRLLHEVLLKSNESEQAAKVMIELLKTYTDKNASHAREDAIRCIVSAMADPKTFLLDPLLSLQPVKFLEGELIHDLLNIFVSENLTAYLKFYNEHKEFVTSQGLNHEQNLQKMRLLSFMQLAESQPELSFDLIEKELQLKPEDVEGFIIEVLKTKLVRARMNQSAKSVYVTSTMHRTFGRAQWQQLRDLLFSWKSNLSSIQEGMKHVTQTQLELLSQSQ
ncbi:eukaryotic translation initiation factor 3 subunit M [Coccinella septempunctata]|uniref:eukaryotic translation initiation factor 3 subunit M n=1 Tax=Coccinella septempunctata TaxID=41139 RepID=UPI001D07A71C|nr:eukaryotic translation initiation factor 3 subunit M [Coccinella septempunctata]